MSALQQKNMSLVQKKKNQATLKIANNRKNPTVPVFNLTPRSKEVTIQIRYLQIDGPPPKKILKHIRCISRDFHSIK